MTVTHRIAVVGFVALCVLVERHADPVCLAEVFEQGTSGPSMLAGGTSG